MPSPGARLRSVRKILKMNQKELADSLGTGYSNISRIEKDEYSLGKAYLELLREKYNVNPNWILYGQEPIFVSRNKKPEDLIPQRIPILAKIPAGPWETWLDPYEVRFAEEYVEHPNVKGENLFAVRVKGDSMEPRLYEGDVLIIDPHRQFDGGIAVIRHGWEYKIRFVRKLNNHYLLVPFNPAYPQEELVPDDNTRIYVPVKVVSTRDI